MISMISMMLMINTTDKGLYRYYPAPLDALICAPLDALPNSCRSERLRGPQSPQDVRYSRPDSLAFAAFAVDPVAGRPR